MVLLSLRTAAAKIGCYKLKTIEFELTANQFDGSS